MTTAADLRVRVLQELGIIAAGETPNAEDASLIDGFITRAQDELVQRRAALWVIDSIPDYAVEPFVQYAAAMAAPTYGVMSKADAIIAKRTALSEIYELTDEGESLSPQKAEYL